MVASFCTSRASAGSMASRSCWEHSSKGLRRKSTSGLYPIDELSSPEPLSPERAVGASVLSLEGRTGGGPAPCRASRWLKPRASGSWSAVHHSRNSLSNTDLSCGRILSAVRSALRTSAGSNKSINESAFAPSISSESTTGTLCSRRSRANPTRCVTRDRRGIVRELGCCSFEHRAYSRLIYFPMVSMVL